MPLITCQPVAYYFHNISTKLKHESVFVMWLNNNVIASFQIRSTETKVDCYMGTNKSGDQVKDRLIMLDARGTSKSWKLSWKFLIYFLIHKYSKCIQNRFTALVFVNTAYTQSDLV